MEGDTPEVREVRAEGRVENDPMGEKVGRGGPVPVILLVPPCKSEGLPSMVIVRVASNDSRGVGVIVTSGVGVTVGEKVGKAGVVVGVDPPSQLPVTGSEGVLL